MIRAILYTLLIMSFFCFLLVSGLLAPDQGKIAIQRFVNFINWKPVETNESLLKDTDESIKEFNQSYAKIQSLREMTLARNQQTFKDLEVIYEQTRKSLKELLFDMGQLSVTERSDLFAKFSVLHAQRAQLVEVIIRDQQVMINLNEQMDHELQAMSQWLNQKALDETAPTANDMMKMRQYESLRSNLKAFNEQSSHLDSMRILFMKKSKESIERLAETNKELENHFRELLSQVEISTSEQSPGIWNNYQHLEAEQRELVANLRSTEEFITANQGQLIAGITVISETVQYSSDTQLQRFKDNYDRMDDQRRELLKNMNQRQQTFLTTRPTMKQMMEDSRYRTEIMRQQARQISDQYQQMEEYRKSTTATLQSMTRELKDKGQFTSQQIEGVMDRSREHIEQFMAHMDSAQSNIKDFIKSNEQVITDGNSSMQRLKDLQQKSSALMDNLKNNEDQMRSLREQAKRDQVSMVQTKNEINRNNAELMKTVKERTDDQKRIMAEKIQDQMQQFKDQQMNQKLNSK